MLPHVQLRSGGLAVPTTIHGVACATTRPVGNRAVRMPASGLHARRLPGHNNSNRL